MNLWETHTESASQAAWVATRHRSVPLSVDEGLACGTAAQRDLLHHMNYGRSDSTMTDRDRVVGTTAHLW